MKLKMIARLAALSVVGVCVSFVGAADTGSSQTGSGPFTNYAILKSTEFGKSMTRNFPTQTTAKQVVKATVPDLVAYFGQKPKLIGVYQDQKDKKSGCVFFSEVLNGKAVRGLSVIKVTDDATHEWIVFCLADAPKGEAMKLLLLDHPTTQPAASGSENAGAGAGNGATGGATPAATPPPATATDNTSAPATAGASSGSSGLQNIPPADIKLTTYSFPDGTGTVGVPDGWTCDAQTIGNCIVKGPADQTVGLDLSGIVDVPSGQSVRMLQMAHGNLQSALIGPYDPDPTNAIKNLIEAVNRIQKARGGSTNAIDQVVNSQPRLSSPGMMDGHTAVIELAVTRTTKGVDKKFHSVQLFSVYTFNGGRDTWCYYASQMQGPEETFKQDFPIMQAIFNSLKENAAAINAKGAAEQNQANQIVAQTNKMTQETNATIDEMNQRQLEADKSFADVDEGIRGYRKVYDTQTGDEADVNLGDVNGVVNALNESDPGRYVQVPLRDEVDQ